MSYNLGIYFTKGALISDSPTQPSDDTDSSEDSIVSLSSMKEAQNLEESHHMELEKDDYLMEDYFAKAYDNLFLDNQVELPLKSAGSLFD